ncbi:ATP-dependent endonuclease [Rouxiella silvae]|uniref:ATP-dependent endonuclease n=1 Tax=Rouxiella silvae TaxID=1646373 RepID=A0AA40WZ08_9GAMM|nr:ATP-dependent endonuclease [Rouxiella silvae]KQN47779.1 ATP-dependent endonuclease [Serratia sp. Leaf50]MBF6635647.1 ATP-dependent endonuclease [Rouxiella silvae]ORJ23231.1 ATP-dependent endonuclease [Rouxiella silvae]
MYLEHIDIVGFRGINRLSLTLTQPDRRGVSLNDFHDDRTQSNLGTINTNTVLLGENAWGKSSLLDALTLLLSPEPELYCFQEQDFHFPAGEQQAKQRYLHVVFTFCENQPGNHMSPRFNPLSPLWVRCDDRLNRIYYRLEGEMDDDGSVATWRTFLAANGEPLALKTIDPLAQALIRLHPVLRLRDARFVRRIRKQDLSPQLQQGAMAKQLDELTRALIHNPQALTNAELRQGLAAMQQLLEHYFGMNSAPSSVNPSGDESSDSAGRNKKSWQQKRHGRAESRQAWRSLNNINQMIAEPNSRSMRVMMLAMFSTLLQAKGAVALNPDARPLLLIEDPETRLHPIMLSVAWGLLEQLPLQRITTTNSGDLLALVPVEQICRLVRESAKVAAYSIGPQGMSSEDSRRIAFHIRYSRPSSLFARCWLLVEGETEVWLLNQLARQCGYNFESEGIKVIEFAQSGLKPLLRFARQMGIEWHVLVDGDEAGRKYAATVSSLVENHEDILRDRLTALPAMDIENYLYRNGFEDVYRRAAGTPEHAPISARHIIEKAVHRSSKPDLAIEVAMSASTRGVGAVPIVLKQMFSRVAWLARGRAD